MIKSVPYGVVEGTTSIIGRRYTPDSDGCDKKKSLRRDCFLSLLNGAVSYARSRGTS